MRTIRLHYCTAGTDHSSRDKESLLPNAPEPDVSDSMDLRKVAPGVSSGVDRRKTNLIKFLYWTCLQLERFVKIFLQVVPWATANLVVIFLPR